MTLRVRFLLLLGLLGLAVIANLAVAVWSVGLLDREQRWANEQIGRVLAPLHDINRSVWDQAQLLGSPGFGAFQPTQRSPQLPDPGPPDPELTRARLLDLSAAAAAAVADLEGFRQYQVSAGVNTVRNLRDRLEKTKRQALAWTESRAPADRDAALTGLHELHELIERLEARLVGEAKFASAHTTETRPRLVLTVAASVTIVVLLLVMAGSFFRRWVLVKAERLRVAAEHLGRGQFEHRIQVEGDDELDRVGAQVNQMASTIETMQAERIERERLAAIGEMSRRVAHNIRNPLAGIRSLAELTMLEAAPGSATAEHQRRILATVDRFGSWLTELLSVSSPPQVSPHAEPVRPWLEGLVEAHRPMADDRRVRLVLDADHAPEQAPIDRRHLEQAVSAILSNAIETSPRGGSVEIRAARAGTRVWEITVADQGPGISPEARSNLFRPYFTTKPGGSGIGLAIAHRVVRDHGGQIRAENRPEPPPDAEFGPGAVFRIELPLAPDG